VGSSEKHQQWCDRHAIGGLDLLAAAFSKVIHQYLGKIVAWNSSSGFCWGDGAVLRRVIKAPLWGGRYLRAPEWVGLGRSTLVLAI